MGHLPAEMHGNKNLILKNDDFSSCHSSIWIHSHYEQQTSSFQHQLYFNRIIHISGNRESDKNVVESDIIWISNYQYRILTFLLSIALSYSIRQNSHENMHAFDNTPRVSIDTSDFLGQVITKRLGRFVLFFLKISPWSKSNKNY